MSIKKVTSHPTQNENLIFERSQTGRIGYRLPKLDVPEMENVIPAEFRRDDDLDGVPEVSEVDVVRHFTRMSTWNYSIDLGMYPLGSCTMKYNSRLNEKVARLGGFANLHPLTPEEESQGALELIYRLQEDLAEITGLPGVSLQPAAGAQGEMTGVMLIRAFLDKRDGEASKDRRVMLIPDSAHGTNPASAALAGFTVKSIRSTAEGLTDMDHLRELCNEGGVAGVMFTNPNTVGIFEKNIKEICEIIHAAGGLVYMDGANMNALVGVARPGDMGVDVIHLNLHKTFSTPHGGGGPGCGPRRHQLRVIARRWIVSMGNLARESRGDRQRGFVAAPPPLAGGLARRSPIPRLRANLSSNVGMAGTPVLSGRKSRHTARSVVCVG